MSTQWLREINTTATGSSTGMPFALKCLALFLQKCLGYLNFSETTSSGSYISTEKTGTGGSINISGADKNFRDDTASAFVAGDVGKWIVIKELTNPENAGIYKITANPDADTVTIDFRSGAAEYPTQNLGDNLSWWVLADNYDVPVTDLDECVLQTPHVNGWWIKIGYQRPASYQRALIRVSGDSGFTTANLLTTYSSALDSAALWFYCAADTEGEFINFVFHNDTSNYHNGMLISNVDLVEPNSGRVASEKVALMGNWWNDPSNSSINTYYRWNTWYRTIAWGSMWDLEDDRRLDVKMIDLSYYLSTDSLCSWTSRQINQRTGKWEFQKQMIFSDVDFTLIDDRGLFEHVGHLQGFYMCSNQIAVRTAVDDVSTKDRFHFYQGHALPWPGYTPQH